MTKLWLPKPHLSASQIGSFDFCPRSYYYQSVVGMRSFGASGFIGGVCHHALEVKYRHMRRFKTIPAEEAVYRVLERRFKNNQDDVTDWEGYSPGYLLNTAKEFLRLHMRNISKQSEPVHIERSFSTVIRGIKLVGFIDMETEKMVWDHKFRFKTLPSGKYDARKELQLSLYAHVTGKSWVGYNIHHLDNRTRTPTITQRTSRRGSKDLEILQDRILSTAQNIDHCARKGSFPKMPAPTRCESRSGWKCAFYDKCWGAQASASYEAMAENLRRLTDLPATVVHKSTIYDDPEVAALPFL